MFKVNDIVEATRVINRIDRRSYLAIGETANIISVYEDDGHQIVGIEISGKKPITDIVCFNTKTPLKLHKI